jgi:hypothetical protein
LIELDTDGSALGADADPARTECSARVDGEREGSVTLAVPVEAQVPARCSIARVGLAGKLGSGHHTLPTTFGGDLAVFA